ncbi:hypothetical protein P171DRAFT_472669 [Karstenula rhodostoma CBS 690.94]|uniref:Uncharacterized protein n=1 Tax=Karstenula rhodostoma CBS 690.94 TaxID=1392251 RepID=A0A9P4PIE6_9PLEO|nr:hypothetical protein P171DRAFT_472669 [Karstenula rhodostoma CBS 690.94]
MALPAPATSSVSDWFSNFAGFQYEPSSGLRRNFDRLASQRGWGRKLEKKRWTECQTTCFAALYGGDADKNKLEKWQDLCREVHITDPPDSISGCRKALGSRDVLVNLVNLIDHRSIGVPVIRFKNYSSFRAYTTGGCVYPKKKAKEEGFIKALLRML